MRVPDKGLCHGIKKVLLWQLVLDFFYFFSPLAGKFSMQNIKKNLGVLNGTSVLKMEY
jgi:hypothetical protein